MNIETPREEEIMGREPFFPEIILQLHSRKSNLLPSPLRSSLKLEPGLEPPAMHLSKELQEQVAPSTTADAVALLMCPEF